MHLRVIFKQHVGMVFLQMMNYKGQDLYDKIPYIT